MQASWDQKYAEIAIGRKKEMLAILKHLKGRPFCSHVLKAPLKHCCWKQRVLYLFSPFPASALNPWTFSSASLCCVNQVEVSFSLPAASIKSFLTVVQLRNVTTANLPGKRAPKLFACMRVERRIRERERGSVMRSQADRLGGKAQKTLIGGKDTPLHQPQIKSEVCKRLSAIWMQKWDSQCFGLHSVLHAFALR